MSGVTINLPSLVDLALGHPEVGAVNFNIMQCILHTILKESGLHNTELEFHGDDAVHLKHLEQIHPVQSQYILSDYKIPDKEKKDDSKRSHKVVVQSINKLDELEDKVNKINDTLFQLLKMPTDETLISTVQSMATPSLPSERLIDETGVMPTPTNLWHLLTVEKRVEAAEEGIDKLTSLIETLVQQSSYGRSTILTDKQLDDDFMAKESKKDLKNIKTHFTDANYDDMLNNMAEHMSTLTERITNLETRYLEIVGYDSINHPSADDSSVSDEYDSQTPITIATTKSQSAKESKASEGSDIDELEAEENDSTLFPKAAVSENSMKKAMEKLKERSITQIGLKELLGRKGSLINALNEIDNLKRSYKKFHNQISEKLREDKKQEKSSQKGEDLGLFCEKTELCLEKFREQINQIDTTFNHQIGEIQHQIANIEIELGVLLEKVNAGGGVDPVDAGGFADVYNKLARIQNELVQITSLTSNLQEDKDEKEAKIEALMESIDFLKSIKADKEDIEDALANKADQQYVNRKVSHDQFDAACDDLSRNLEDALLKLTQQEEFWNETLEAIQSEIEKKLDKTDIQPLHDFVTGKLKALHERLQALAAFKRETEAAGTKTRLLKDVNCLSCDQPAVMLRNAQIPSIPEECPLPPNRSMKPYLTYELDNARRQRRKGQFHRNLNNIEVTKEHQPRSDNREMGKIIATDHLCNRYCGGSHTVTAPSQRVTHKSHYLQPQGALTTVPLTEGFAQGNDGKIYKIRQEESQTTSIKAYSTAPCRADNEFGDQGYDEENVKNMGMKILYKRSTELLLKAKETQDTATTSTKMRF